MPTPAHIRAASLAKRQRVCVICDKAFVVRSVDRKGAVCSKTCHAALNARQRLGTKQSEETKAKRAASLRAARANPETNKRWSEAAAAGLKTWLSDEDNARGFAQRSSERMTARHRDPEWQEVRNERSSRTMKRTWEESRDLMVQAAIERSERHRLEGIGIWNAETIGRKNEACKWIMQRCQEALRAETDYNAAYSAAQARLREEMPYDGPLEGADYMLYLQRLGTATVGSPECRGIADPFLRDAIPRFAEQWRKTKAATTDR